MLLTWHGHGTYRARVETVEPRSVRAMAMPGRRHRPPGRRSISAPASADRQMLGLGDDRPSGHLGGGVDLDLSGDRVGCPPPWTIPMRKFGLRFSAGLRNHWLRFPSTRQEIDMTTAFKNTVRPRRCTSHSTATASVRMERPKLEVGFLAARSNCAAGRRFRPRRWNVSRLRGVLGGNPGRAGGRRGVAGTSPVPHREIDARAWRPSAPRPLGPLACTWPRGHWRSRRSGQRRCCWSCIMD